MSAKNLSDFLGSISEDADLRAKILALRNEVSAEDFAPRVAALATERGYSVTAEEISGVLANEIPDGELSDVSGGFLVHYLRHGNPVSNIPS